jgi:two-component system CheB/CheR fusion protein
VTKIPDALVGHDRRTALGHTRDGSSRDASPRDGSPPPGKSAPPNPAHDWLAAFIDLLRTKTAHDFTLYKPGTLQRRIERRMAMAAIGPNGMAQYLDLLRRDANELDLLAKDLLINVTGFFRDPKVFDLLAAKIVPDLIRNRSSDQPVRIWVTGCSTGEEAYSLAMLFREQITEAQSNTKVQVFASDVDPDAVAAAREGLYPATIEADVSPARLARFFSRDDHGYRVVPELRAMVVFTVQDVQADPPFARLDLISCRNLLIRPTSSRCSISHCARAAFCCLAAPRRSAMSTIVSRSSPSRSDCIAASDSAGRGNSALPGVSVTPRGSRRGRGKPTRPPARPLSANCAAGWSWRPTRPRRC